MTQNPIRRLIKCAKALSAEYEFALNKSQWVETAKMWVSLRNAIDALPPAIAEGDVVMVPRELVDDWIRDLEGWGADGSDLHIRLSACLDQQRED